MLQRSLHGGVAVAAAWAALEAAWVRGTAGEAPARGRRAVGRLRGDALVPARSKGEVGVGRGRPSVAGGRRTAPAARESRERQTGEEDRDLNAISENSKDLNVNQ